MPTSTGLPQLPRSHRNPAETIAQVPKLEQELKSTFSGEVRFDPGSRALYASDGSNYRQVPIGLVIPRNADDVVAALAVCRKYGVAVLSRGAGTSLAGQCCNVAVIFDFSKYMNKILELDPLQKYARVQPGVVLDTLRNLAEKDHLTFGPDPSTHSRCTLGGMIGNNSCGTHSLLAGKTVDNIGELRILLHDGTEMTVGPTSDTELEATIAQEGRRGQIYSKLRSIRDRYAHLIRERFPNIPRRVSGYNLDQLLPENGFNVARALVGTEGTCVIVLEAKATLIPSPRCRSLVGLGYADAFEAADNVPEILEFHPIGLEGFEGAMIDGLKRKNAPNLGLMPRGRGFLLVEFGADDRSDADRAAGSLMNRLQLATNPPDMRLYTESEARAVWKIRESGPRAAGSGPGLPPRWEGWDDASVAPEKLGPYLRDLRRLLDEYNYQATYYGHFGHGCIHMQVSFDLQTQDGIRRYAEFIERAADLVVAYGGSLSGEHGDGQARGALLPKMFGPELMNAFREFKSVWDPDNKMNPRKVVDAYLPTENLRLGTDYQPVERETHFKFSEDGGSLAKASLRCIGIGECRKQDSGTMCPSYMATLEEQHSPRGRAHMLFEVLRGDFLRDGWADEDVKRSLDLCLSCKACKSECPTNVDIATYRAEFLSHYYERNRRPLHAYAFGMIDRWARVGSMAPGLANLVTRAPGISTLLRKVLHLAPERELPRLAAINFRRWARRRGVPGVGNQKGHTPPPTDAKAVILWSDTFNNYFHPETSQAALDILARAGFRVTVPRDYLCCGRPLYDFGMLDQAKQYSCRILKTLGPEIDAGRPIVVLEPSCASVFRDELHGLFPTDPRADKLRRQTFLLSEFLDRYASGQVFPPLRRKVLLHGHCHQKSLMRMISEESLLRNMGSEVESIDAGCCGMAGPFGFAEDKFELSKAIAERVLMPAVRNAPSDTLIVSDGFSCQEQILQLTGRRAIHLAQAMQLASIPGEDTTRG